jgi:hypothetical protein
LRRRPGICSFELKPNQIHLDDRDDQRREYLPTEMCRTLNRVPPGLLSFRKCINRLSGRTAVELPAAGAAVQVARFHLAACAASPAVPPSRVPPLLHRRAGQRSDCLDRPTRGRERLGTVR